MATIFRTLSYKYQWLYNTVSRLAALGVGGEKRFRSLAWQNLTLQAGTKILDMCCGAGQTTKYLVRYSEEVTGLDISPVALARAAKNVPQAKYVEGLAQKMLFANNSFDIVHTSVALHEMTLEELEAIMQEVYRILKPGGIFCLMDLHKPDNFLFFPPLAVFMWLFETETAWQLIDLNLVDMLKKVGFLLKDKKLYLGGSLQVIQVSKGCDSLNLTLSN